ncbi:MAG: hypothetical protein ABS44_08560 [Chryseobacterium sp. SCN 40-13]|nr:MAG: hypothetical protein ABS44_08560 [Chryseobacterium sp. SCN 40-13]
MKIRFKARLLLGTLLFLLFLVSCRQEFLKEDSPSHFATQKNKFQVVKLKDIPHVSNFIKMKTGRKDLKIPMAGKSLAYSKGALEFESLETDFILKKEEDEVAYYIFGISNAGDESTIYNFEVKEVGGDIERAELIEFSSATPYEEDYSNLFRFSGTVTAYNEQKQQVSIGIFDEGVNPECPSTYPPGEGGGGGGGEMPVITPGWPPDPYNPIPPDWPQWPGSPPDSGGGGESGGNIPPNTAGCGEYMLEIFFYKNSNGDDVGLWVNECGHQYFGSQPKSYAIMTTNKIGPHCNDGSGIIILPGNPKDNTPCKKITAAFADDRFKEKVAAIDKPSVFNMDHEMGYAAGYPINTTLTETQYPPMENKVGTHSVNLPSGSQYFGFIHSHTNRDGVVKMFSPGDLHNFLMRCVQAANQHGNISDAYAMVITSSGNYMLKFTGTNVNFGVGTGTMKWWNKWYTEDYMEPIQNNDGTFDQNKVEKAFLQFLKEKVKIGGIELYSVEKETGTAKKLTLDAKNNVKSDACP